MKHVILAGVALGALTIALSANAADLPTYKSPPSPIPFSWTGCYGGAQVGGAFGRQTFSDVPANAGNITGTVGSNKEGVLAGGQAGCNYQVNNWVFGLEGDASWADISGDTYDPFFSNKNVQTIHQRTDFLADVTGRLGYSFDRWMIYGKGGVAFTHDSYNLREVNTLYSPFQTASETGSGSRTGWALGAGVEWALWNSWSVKAEYMHYDFGARNQLLTTPGSSIYFPPASFMARIRQTDDTFKVGLNYHFFTH